MPSRPGPLTLIAFGCVAMIGGSNVVAVRLSNRELPPFWGAGMRFAVASILLFAIVAAARLALPSRKALPGTVAFGLLNFFGAYAFLYWGLQEAPAALAGAVLGAVPLLTFILATTQGIESFRWRPLGGAIIAISGVAVMAGLPSNDSVPLLSFAAIVGGALCIAESMILIKRTSPTTHPVALNAVAMMVGAPPLLALSLLMGERWTVPSEATTWYTLVYLVPVGSVALFILAVFVIRTWTASAASYQFVLFPVVSAVVAAVVAGEALTLSVATGSLLVVVGVYVGAFSQTPKPAPVPPTTTPPAPVVGPS